MITENEARQMLVNPFYAIEIAPILAEPHAPTISEDQWVAANANLIRELGAEAWLRELLGVLKGNYVTTSAGTTSAAPRPPNRSERRAQRRRR